MVRKLITLAVIIYLLKELGPLLLHGVAFMGIALGVLP
jgi:hypothetical protein